MDIRASDLQTIWEETSYYDDGFKKLNVSHPLEWFVGYKEDRQKTLLLVYSEEMNTLPSSRSISVTKGQRTDERWALSLRLLLADHEEVFETLCADLINYSNRVATAKNSLCLVEKRFKHWSKLLQYGQAPILSLANQKGLLGELFFLVQVIENGRTPLEAIQGWGGPEGADQDFTYADIWYEVKSIGRATETVTISSLEQLDNVNSGELIIMRFDKATPEYPRAFSLGEVVQQIFSTIDNQPALIDLLETKLAQYGYIDLPEYTMQKYTYSGQQAYIVNSDFPRIISSSIPVQIVQVKYSLSLATLEPWKKDEVYNAPRF